MRKKFTLIADEQNIVARIPSAAKALEILARFEERRVQARADRIALGHELHIIRKRIAKVGSGGLFTRWLKSIGLSRERAYAYIAIAGHGMRKTDSPCYVRKLAFIRYQSMFTRAKSKAEKKRILVELVAWVKKEFKF